MWTVAKWQVILEINRQEVFKVRRTRLLCIYFWSGHVPTHLPPLLCKRCIVWICIGHNLWRRFTGKDGNRQSLYNVECVFISFLRFTQLKLKTELWKISALKLSSPSWLYVDLRNWNHIMIEPRALLWYSFATLLEPSSISPTHAVNLLHRTFSSSLAKSLVSSFTFSLPKNEHK